MEEGPYAQTNFMLNKFDFSVSITFTSFAFLFLKGNYFKGTNLTSLVQGLITTANIYMYTHVYFVHIRICTHMCTSYTYEYMLRFSPSILRALQVSRPDPWAHIRVPHIICVRVCIHTLYIHMHSDSCPNHRENTDKNFYLSHVKNNASRQQKVNKRIENKTPSSTNAKQQTAHTRVHA